jgi:hypothetical protein
MTRRWLSAARASADHAIFSRVSNGPFPPRVFKLLLIHDTVIDTALEMIDRYALHAYEAVKLAVCITPSAITAEAFTFVCWDRRLLTAARSQQLAVLDPAA